MSETLKTILLTSVVTPFIVFQISVIVFIIYSKLKKKSFYDSSFFTLFAMLTIVDTVAEVGTIVALNFPAVPALEFLFIENRIAATALYQLSSYTLFTQCYLHCGIAINRFWTVLRSLNKGYSETETYGRYCIWGIPFITLPFIAPRFWFDANFIRDGNGRLWPAYFESKEVKVFISNYSTALCLLSSIFCFVLQLATAFKYRSLLQNNNTNTTGAQKNKIKQEMRFLGQAMIALCAQLLTCAIQLLMSIATYTGNDELNAIAFQNYMWSQNVSNLTAPVALILVGKQLRNDWIDFILRRPASNVIMIKSQSSVQRARTTVGTV